MRHFLCPGPVAAHPDGVAAPPAQARLVTPACRPQTVPPRPRRAVASAVALTTVTVAAVAAYRTAPRRQAQPSNRQDTPRHRDSADPSAAAAAVPRQGAPELRGFRPPSTRLANWSLARPSGRTCRLV